ncbi:hypothetical protein XELAEV_18007431mg [Xenopus laevis]|uniref:Uncharacterized protein n=1 Tax=Xenopus laevis TaxID=8355 RepID=A0A974E152_XENLA|nr:hypothetical protein XELAEV_18007431mg [Xenopus laevis]
MGTRFAPQNANLFMEKLEEDFLIYSDTTERNHHLKTLKADFIERGYNPWIVDQYISRSTRIPRINWVPLVVTYNPQLKTLKKIARYLQGTLHKDEWIKSIFPDPPLLAFRQPSNVKKTYNKKCPITAVPTKNGTYPCGKRQCKTCRHILISDKIQMLNTLEEYSIYGQYNCSSSSAPDAKQENCI